jgi:hypothetical protein
MREGKDGVLPVFLAGVLGKRVFLRGGLGGDFVVFGVVDVVG